MEPDVPIENNLASDLQLIVPNSAQALFRRYGNQPDGGAKTRPDGSRGMARLPCPDGIARMGFADLLKLWRRKTPLIWHARRNDEMIAGVLLRALGWPLNWCSLRLRSATIPG